MKMEAPRSRIKQPYLDTQLVKKSPFGQDVTAGEEVEPGKEIDILCRLLGVPCRCPLPRAWTP
jgi:hypothetical protein